MAAQPSVISQLSSLPFEAKHINAHKALVHKTGDMQVNVYTLDPGGRIPPHRHTISWDVSIVLDGQLAVSYLTDAAREDHDCGPGAITLVPPGVVHEITNPSSTDTATFVLVQSPSDGFDFLLDTEHTDDHDQTTTTEVSGDNEGALLSRARRRH